MANFYDVGQTVTLTGTFSDDEGYADPTTILLKVQDPAGTETVYDYDDDEIERSSEGIYTKDVNTDAPGRWFYRWEGTTNSVVAVIEDYFVVKPSEFDGS